MSVRIKSSRVRLVAAVVSIAIPGFVSAVHAGTIWDGGATGGGWTSANNWDGNVLPTFNSSTALTFGAASFARPSTFIQTTTTVGSLTFNSNVPSGGASVSLFGFPSGPTQVGYVLTMGGVGAPAGITVDSGVIGQVTIGRDPANTTTAGSANGSLLLADNLTINQNSSSALLLINRPIQGTSFGVTKNGVGTFQSSAGHSFTGPISINGGRWIANAFASGSTAFGTDLDSSSGVSLNGATLDIQTGNGSAPKTFTVPVTVTATSTLSYFTNFTTARRDLSFSGTNSFALNADLSIVNNTAFITSQAQGINLSRTVTGTGKITVSTLNNPQTNTDNSTPQRVFIFGHNPGWSGGLTIAQGTATLGAPVGGSPAGTGPLTIGTTGSSLGAVLGFNQGSDTNQIDITLPNAVVVRGGGFRQIRNNGSFSPNITFTGPVTLEGSLTIDHTVAFDRYLTFSGDITGTGNLNITRGGGTAAAGSGVRLGGTNTFVGNTSVATDAGLYIDGSIASSITVAAGGAIGGEGSVTGNVTIGTGGTISFDGANVTNWFHASGTIDTTAGASTKIVVQSNAWPQSGSGIVVLEAGTLLTNGVSDFTIGRGSLRVVGNQVLYDTGAVGNVVWRGQGVNGPTPTQWNVSAFRGNFTLLGAGDFFLTGDNVLFDDTASNFSPVVQAPLTAGTLTFNNNSTNSYTVSGFGVTSTSITKNGANSVVLNNSSTVTGSITVNAGTLTVNSPLSATGDATVSGGQLVVNTPLRPVTGSLVVTGPGAATLAAPATATSATGYTVAGEFASVSVGAGATVTVPAVDRSVNKASVVVTSGLSLDGTLNLGTGDLIFKGGAASTEAVRGLLGSGALTSSGVPLAVPYTTLALFPNDAGDGITPYFSSYDGVTGLTAGDLIVKYTYVGDTNLDGTLDGADLAQVLEGYSTGQSGWAWGDVDNSGGAVSLADATAFLTAYNYYQSNSQPSLGTGQGVGGGGTGAVPEPSALGILAVAVPMISRRRRR